VVLTRGGWPAWKRSSAWPIVLRPPARRPVRQNEVFPESPLEGDRFEPSVPCYGELGASGAFDATHAAIVKPGTPDRSRRRARRAICGTPGAPSHRLKPFIEPWRRNAEIGEFTERGATIAKTLGIYVGAESDPQPR
jgi:hypothetical protein